MKPIYDKIGTTYNQTRRADARIIKRIVELLDLPEGARILDVGAGTGSYSRALADMGYQLTALEPSRVMREQALDGSQITWVSGIAEALPFADRAFDAAILILCIHHFNDPAAALREVRRVSGAGPILIFTYDPEATEEPWLFEYFPIFRTQIQASFPFVADVRMLLASDGEFFALPFHLPHDLVDGFAGSAWRYPERYLEPDFRNGTSAFRQLDADVCQEGLESLSADLKSGAWESRHGALRCLDEYDHGYTFLLSRGELQR
jgi:ubiquinone/menaquinone biosynthesis C-methylase UbiE